MTIHLEHGKYYHIYNRGNNRENLFYYRKHYDQFLENYFRYCHPVLDTMCYCLLPNHFHMLIRVRNEDEQNDLIQDKVLPWTLPLHPSRQLSHFFNSYAQSINKQQGRVGSLFQKNFQRREIDDPDYFFQTVIYIHRNPLKHGLISHFEHYEYSSFRNYFPDSFKPYPINTELTLQEFGGFANFIAAHYS